VSDIPVTDELGEENPASHGPSDDRELLANMINLSRQSEIVDDWGRQSFPASDAPQNW
jgi:hypothetical protein